MSDSLVVMFVNGVKSGSSSSMGAVTAGYANHYTISAPYPWNPWYGYTRDFRVYSTTLR